MSDSSGWLYVLRYEQVVYGDPKDPSREIIAGPPPPLVFPDANVGPRLLAHVVVSKYLGNLSFYRQQQRFKNEGIDISRADLVGWVNQITSMLEPFHQTLHQEAFKSGYLQVHEKLLRAQNAKESQQGHFWVCLAPAPGLLLVNYDRSPSRWAHFSDFPGALPTVGYAVHDAFESVAGITLHGCWAQARRYFYEAREVAPKRTRHALDQIQLVYDVEQRLREQGASVSVREEVRKEESFRILVRLIIWLREQEPGEPNESWGRAVRYTRARWRRLLQYTADGRVEIDNTQVENAIRPFALGRKNYRFMGSHASGQRAAIFYSLLGTCLQQGIDPEDWLTDVLIHFAMPPPYEVLIADLLPHRWDPQSSREPSIM